MYLRCAFFFFLSSPCHTHAIPSLTTKFSLQPDSATCMSFSDLLNMPNAPHFLPYNNLSPTSKTINSSPMTLIDNTSLLSPASISFGARTSGISTRAEGHEMPTYIYLWHQFQQCEQDFMKLKQEYKSLRYVFLPHFFAWLLTLS